MYEEITQNILDILKADPTLAAAIKGWYFGQHDIRKPKTRYPFIDAKWRGGPIKKLKTGRTVITRRTITFWIRCVDRHFDEAMAEKSVMALTEQIETVLDADETLGDLVSSSTITEVLSDAVVSDEYSVVGSHVSLETKK